MSELQHEEDLNSKMTGKFGDALSNITIQRKNRIWLEVTAEKLPELLRFMKTEMGYNHLATITGMDEGEKLGGNYHMTDTHGMITVKARTPRTAPTLPTVTEIFPGAVPYERELEDLLGIKIAGLAPGRRYPLPDDFPTDQYPLRKDWKAEKTSPENEVKQEAK